jgi:hypothetical protein
MGHGKLANYYNTNFALMQYHHWSLTETESMMPWERYVYIDLLQAYLKSEEQKQRDMEAYNKAGMRARR